MDTKRPSRGPEDLDRRAVKLRCFASLCWSMAPRFKVIIVSPPSQSKCRRWRLRGGSRQTALLGEARSINIRSVCLFSLYGRKIQSNLRRSNRVGDCQRRSLAPRVVIERTIDSAFFLPNLLRRCSVRVSPIASPIVRSPVLSSVDRPRSAGTSRGWRTGRSATYCRYGFLDVRPSVASFVTVGAMRSRHPPASGLNRVSRYRCMASSRALVAHWSNMI